MAVDFESEMYKKQRLKCENILNKVQKNVKGHFPEIYHSFEMGIYIKPQNYFVAYIFLTNEQLMTAQQNGLLEK